MTARVAKTSREQELEKALLDLLRKVNTIAGICEDGIDGYAEGALIKVYKSLPSDKQYEKYLKLLGRKTLH